jgi:hypothetical protein
MMIVITFTVAFIPSFVEFIRSFTGVICTSVYIHPHFTSVGRFHPFYRPRRPLRCSYTTSLLQLGSGSDESNWSVCGVSRAGLWPIIYIYIHVYPSLAPESSSRCGLASQTRTCMGTFREIRSIELLCFQTSALEGVEGSASRPGSFLPPGKTRYPLYRRQGGPQGRTGQVRKILPPPGFFFF